MLILWYNLFIYSFEAESQVGQSGLRRSLSLERKGLIKTSRLGPSATCCVNQAGHWDAPASASQALGSKSCATTTTTRLGGPFLIKHPFVFLSFLVVLSPLFWLLNFFSSDSSRLPEETFNTAILPQMSRCSTFRLDVKNVQWIA